MGKSIGIDLGTTNSVVAFKDATVRVIATGPNIMRTYVVHVSPLTEVAALPLVMHHTRIGEDMLLIL